MNESTRLLSLYITTATVLTLVIISVYWQGQQGIHDVNSQVLRIVTENQEVIHRNQDIIEELQAFREAGARFTLDRGVELELRERELEKRVQELEQAK